MVFFLQRNITALLFVVIASSVDVVSGTCLGNGVGQICESSSERPNIACCIRTKTGASYNACCSDDEFSTVGVFKDTTVDDDASECKITGTGVGCPTTVVPGNDGSTSTDFGDKTPCLRVSEDSTCSNKQNDPTKNYGTCTNTAEGTFDVCCVGTNTGTYAVGDSCMVSLPYTSISKGADDEDSSIADLDVVGDATLSASISTSASATVGVPTSISSITGVVVIVTTLLYSFFL